MDPSNMSKEGLDWKPAYQPQQNKHDNIMIADKCFFIFELYKTLATLVSDQLISIYRFEHLSIVASCYVKVKEKWRVSDACMHTIIVLENSLLHLRYFFEKNP